MPNHAAFNWKFHRIGGLDQVTLRTPEELLHLNELDPKLWVALSCPIDKLQFDARTLELLDADKDGRIRIQEVLDAVHWTVDRLSDPALLAESRPELALEEIRQDTDEGRLLYSTASRILTQSGKEGALTQEDVAEAIDAATQTAFNGDGVMTPHPSFDPDMNRFIEDIVATTGGATDAGSFRPLARHKVRAPAMRLPSVLYELLNGFFIILFVVFERLTNRPYFLILNIIILKKPFSVWRKA